MWYEEAMASCFDTEPRIPDVLFLRIFAAPMCIPCSANYKKAGKRKAGAQGKTEQRPPARVWEDQKQLLDKAATAVAAWKVPAGSMKDRLNDLMDLFYCLGERSVIPDSEFDYAKKNSNYKETAFLSFFMNAPEAEMGSGFPAAAAFYGAVFEKLFSETPDQAQRCVTALKQRLSAAGGRLSMQEAATLWQQLGAYFCARLILGAACGSNVPGTEQLLETLFAIAASKSTGTRSVMPLRNVTLEGGQFVELCQVVLDSQPELPMLEMLYKILCAVRRRADGQLDVATLSLVERYVAALDGFGRRTREQLNARGWEGDPAVEADIRRAAVLIAACRSWLPQNSCKTVWCA